MAKERTRDEMIYVPVAVNLKYHKGCRKLAVADAKDIISSYTKGINHEVVGYYTVSSKGKIRSRKAT